MDNDYRYMIYNDVRKEYQFARICEPTEKGAESKLFQLIGYDSCKYRFRIKKLPKERALQIKADIKFRQRKEKLERYLPGLKPQEIEKILKVNDLRIENRVFIRR